MSEEWTYFVGADTFYELFVNFIELGKREGVLSEAKARRIAEEYHRTTTEDFERFDFAGTALESWLNNAKMKTAQEMREEIAAMFPNYNTNAQDFEVEDLPLGGKLIVDEEIQGWRNERRSVSETGGEKGVKFERYDLIPVRPLESLAQRYGYGAEKYAERNWERGYEFSKSYAACQRHLNAFWRGEDEDEEMPGGHLGAAAFHIFALMQFTDPRNPEYRKFDDRPHEREEQ